ncbi:sulfite exporter TauE/SafE family protein [Pyrobaculum aerophilum]|uniref:sulfite exporter TauE/SafE family protein n=1 Tax=Pyrobaculum aerophilum TaxID=13773 RepID=UPI0023F2D2AD|nr:sulfite exporter TauE/SafE family protein [Pyrobaculum aerophilum]MCX8137058.1 sulfite exporter TauE/SafE family protein [Pyrobaculum aerophilum]
MFWLALLAGFIGGFLGPLIGVGGGVIIVPMLNLSGVAFQAAAAASLFSIVVTAITSIYNYRGVIDFGLLAKYAAFSMAAAVLSAFISVKYSGSWVKLIYGVYLIAIGIVLLIGKRPGRTMPWLGYLLVFIGGFVSSLFGVGGGTIFVPALILLAGLDAKLAAAMSMGIIFPTALASTATYAWLGALDLSLAVLIAIGSFGGSYLSSKYIMPRLKSSSVKKLFTSYVFAVGAYYLWSNLSLALS